MRFCFVSEPLWSLLHIILIWKSAIRITRLIGVWCDVSSCLMPLPPYSNGSNANAILCVKQCNVLPGSPITTFTIFLVTSLTNQVKAPIIINVKFATRFTLTEKQLRHLQQCCNPIVVKRAVQKLSVCPGPITLDTNANKNC
ncbi:hypothetical protein PoB_007232400 [Plakobranchus ocellatus]|uniref:Secreted protein n=1 Tax=Plakobranchus ocellatus TaxID=259542 RepID=A0AAV4DNP1_9GAST|nr:hypothetical protein PoB_007232400 [Plakobranchus ocellatus]